MVADWPEPVERVSSFLRDSGAEARIQEFADGTPTAADAAAAVGCGPRHLAQRSRGAPPGDSVSVPRPRSSISLSATRRRVTYQEYHRPDTPIHLARSPSRSLAPIRPCPRGTSDGRSFAMTVVAIAKSRWRIYFFFPGVIPHRRSIPPVSILRSLRELRMACHVRDASEGCPP